MKMADIAVLGHGVVGSGVLEVLLSHGDSITRRAKEAIRVRYVLDLREFPELPYAEIFTKDFDRILQDPEVRIVVECMGGLEPAFTYAKACLSNGKSFVTSNKELVAARGAELLALAQKNNLNFLFEASVGGGIPIIRPISQCLAANEVSEIAGILNGTTNFILTKMIRERMAFADALSLAQQLGYAERDPSADVEGADACRKICILASLAFGSHVYPEDVHTEGITQITLEDVAYADAWGGVVKLIGEVKMLDSGKLSIQVAPMFISWESQLANVDDVFNGILVRGDATGDVVFYGKGAGKLPTASAVVADVIDCVKHLKSRKYLFWEDAKPDLVEPYGTVPEKFFVRLQGPESSDQAFAQAQTRLPGAARIIRRDEAPGEVGLSVGGISENQLRMALDQLAGEGLRVLNRVKISDF